MSMTLNERNPNVDAIYIGSQITVTTVILPGLYFRKHSRIKNVWFVDQAGITLSASNYQTVTLQDMTGAPVVYAKIATSAVAAVANTPLLMVPTTPVGTDLNEVDVPAGTMLTAKVVGTGTAVLTSAILLVEWYPC